MKLSNLFDNHEKLEYLEKREKTAWLRLLIFFLLGFILGGIITYCWIFFY